MDTGQVLKKEENIKTGEGDSFKETGQYEN
jgi:hypothetical protein